MYSRSAVQSLYSVQRFLPLYILLPLYSINPLYWYQLLFSLFLVESLFSALCKPLYILCPLNSLCSFFAQSMSSVSPTSVQCFPLHNFRPLSLVLPQCFVLYLYLSSVRFLHCTGTAFLMYHVCALHCLFPRTAFVLCIEPCTLPPLSLYSTESTACFMSCSLV